jgi:hypothetical protein
MIRTFLALAATLALLWCVAGDSGAQPKAANVGKAEPPVGWPREVRGYGKTLDDAKENALKQAVIRIKVCLESQNPPLDAWHPDKNYVRDYLLDGPGRAGEEDVPLLDNADVKAKVWIQPIRQSPKWGEIVHLNQAAQRRELSAHRQTLAGYAVAILTALLTIAWGYLRVDEWTQGRITRWLQIGAVTLLVLGGAAWLLVQL